jgi:hypothetical protein
LTPFVTRANHTQLRVLLQTDAFLITLHALNADTLADDTASSKAVATPIMVVLIMSASSFAISANLAPHFPKIVKRSARGFNSNTHVLV